MDEIKDISLVDAEFVIIKFGGIRPMAQKLGIPVSTVQGWKQRQSIPQNRTVDILAAANKYDLDLTFPKTIAIDTEDHILQDKSPFVSSRTYNDKRQSNRRVFFVSVSVLCLVIMISGIGFVNLWIYKSIIG